MPGRVQARNDSPKAYRTIRRPGARRKLFSLLRSNFYPAVNIMTTLDGDSATSQCEPRFDWDIDISNQPFWADLGSSSTKIARAFLACCDDRDLAKVQISIGGESDRTTKLRLLRDKIKECYLAESAQVDPSRLQDVRPLRWRSLQVGLNTMEYFLGDLEAAERIGYQLYEHGLDGSKDLSALHALSSLWEEMGKYSEAEAAARVVLPWLQAHPTLGDANSPQALGSMKLLVKCLWKQGRHAEAEIWIGNCDVLIQALGDGKFKKYQEDEKMRWASDLHNLRRGQ